MTGADCSASLDIMDLRRYTANPESRLRLRFSGHAEDRLRERKISKADAENAYREPDITYDDPKGNPCYVRHASGKRVEVVIRKGSNPPFVITIMD